VLSAVSCTSATACTAVGSYGDSPLIERWNGSSWSIQKAPAVRNSLKGVLGSWLTGVSCTARTLCTAVGEVETETVEFYAIALRWTGRGWSLSPSPDWRAFVHAVSCASATVCTWVGELYPGSGPQGYPVLGGWDGMHWTKGGTISLPNAAFSTALNAVSCTAANACTAVGGQGIALAWNGSVWSSQQTATTRRPERSVMHLAHGLHRGRSRCGGETLLAAELEAARRGRLAPACLEEGSRS
jgi:hypothetical protein